MQGIYPRLLRYGLLVDVVNSTLNKSLRRGKTLNILVHNERKTWIYLAYAGDKTKANLVAQIFRSLVRRILTVGYMFLHSILHNLLACGTHQRAHDTSHLLVNTCQATQSRTA